MIVPDFQSNCADCVGLCCVALAFDHSDSFAFDKPSGEACHNLDDNFRCKIHSSLKDAGFSGCVAYDCLGAGQRVTAIYDGVSWQKNREYLTPMMDSFRAMRKVQELLQLLTTAGKLPLPDHVQQTLTRHIATLMPLEGWTPQNLTTFERGPIPKHIQSFMRDLRDYVLP
ncbi:MAG: hypothetical protein JKY31_03090 [Rhodobacteraceae bacterium]|nr:hypothetical protein [Paracoccaceae bacterium]